MIDPRIVRLGIEVGGSIKYYEGLYIYAKGTKFTSPNQGQATVTILNINRETREYLLRVANPFNSNKERKRLILEVGRESYGTTVLYTGDIFRVAPTQSPDIGVTIRCVTGGFNKNNIVSDVAPASSKLSSIATMVATNNGLGLSFEITDKNIGNFSYTGSSAYQINKLAELSGADVFQDNGTLYVKEFGKPKSGASVRVLSKKSGMVGDPEGTENGVKVTMLFDPVTQIGSQLSLTSEKNPILDGEYCIYKLEFDISSMDNPFYLTAEANRLQ